MAGMQVLDLQVLDLMDRQPKKPAACQIFEKLAWFAKRKRQVRQFLTF
jgi:hypothetical protein